MANNTPQLLKGFRDFPPDKMSARFLMFATIRAAFERFGFAPMETPAVEYAETLTGKYGAEEKLIYKFKDNGGRDVALRYDLTVPLARFYLNNKNDLPRPFKRYCIGPVWRAESPQKGRYREFYQCDVDVAGSSAALADAECIAAIAAAFGDLGIKDFTIRLNSRKILDGVMGSLAVPSEKKADAMRLLDKLEKAGERIVRAELLTLGLAKPQIEKLFKLLGAKISGDKALRAFFADLLLENSRLAEGINELGQVLGALAGFGVKNVLVDLKLARGLDYYTGMICEMTLDKLPGFGSIAGGGRYDNLIGSIAGGKEVVPAVGMSIGVDRLLAALEELGLGFSVISGSVIVFNLEKELLPVYQTMAGELRSGGISTEMYFEPADLDKQFKYAEKKKANFALIVGGEEVKSKSAKKARLSTRKQTAVKAEKLVGEVLKLLEK
ncbi:MAG: histidine--tRNA ligase [Patescibacteria group bacterium]|nr:histidine--tRNA ligase [Patescibacteria group bacterium]